LHLFDQVTGDQAIGVDELQMSVTYDRRTDTSMERRSSHCSAVRDLATGYDAARVVNVVPASAAGRRE
jgi:hypothetical protein